MVHARQKPSQRDQQGRVHGSEVDDRYLNLNPDPLGPQHDEREPGWFGGRFKWAEGLREVQPEAILHSSVLKRFAAKDGVQHYYVISPYRPGNLSNHVKLQTYYGAATPSRRRASQTQSCRQQTQFEGGVTKGVARLGVTCFA
jgi:hypothetical protein